MRFVRCGNVIHVGTPYRQAAVTHETLDAGSNNGFTGMRLSYKLHVDEPQLANVDLCVVGRGWTSYTTESYHATIEVRVSDDYHLISAAGLNDLDIHDPYFTCKPEAPVLASIQFLFCHKNYIPF
eukprot:TRINITY_DN6438_c0_g1_i1.p1 TRINITY_DN6438_c0_g1~~TRINITY_DN6438_c0_g1_i1.p1  ORF type:complete len:125 (-),score=14.14 TRINITY_DN6438_c0_g1_i1:224-598(-)